MISTQTTEFVVEPVSHSEFKAREPALHTSLLMAQQQCLDAGRPVVVLVSGVEAAGKSEVVNRFSSWLDMRRVRTCSYWQSYEEEQQRPRDWRFWRDLPGKGDMVIVFGSWYSKVLNRPLERGEFDRDRRLTTAAQKELRAQCQHIKRFERLLVEEGVILVKLWFHVSAEAQEQRIRKKLSAGHYVNPVEYRHAGYYEEFVGIADQVMDQTNTAAARWHVIHSEDEFSRDLRAGEMLLNYLNGNEVNERRRKLAPRKSAASRLEALDLKARLAKPEYRRELQQLQEQLAELHWQSWRQQRSTVIVFEGWDAAGKGGAIRRLTAKLDPRLYRAIPIAAPTDEELAHHYLWRFWRHIPRDGYMTIYDRSWYGRVLVERVEDLVSKRQWRVAYEEISDFEQQLTDHGVILIKFWLHISAKEQLRRFRQRERVIYKRHKLGEEDWRNRKRRPEYLRAIEDMLAHTDTEPGRWNLIAAEDKRYARIEILRTVRDRIAAGLTD